MQLRTLPEDAGTRAQRRRHLRRRCGWLSARFVIPATSAGAISVLVLSCGDGTVEPTPAPAPVATTVTVNPTSATLAAIEETTRFTAEVRDQNGQVMAGAAVAWASNDASVATVDASGLVTAAANGSATITAAAGSVSGTAAVTVAQVVSAVAVSPSADTLVALGDTVRLAAEAIDANGHGVAGSEFSWSSSDTLVAKVDDSGLVESLAEGEAVVSATAAEVSGGAALNVVAPLPTAIAVSPDSVRLTALGQTLQLAAEVREQVGRVMAGAFVSWSSGDTLVATVDSAGLVTAVGGGTTTVTAAAGDVSGTVSVAVTQSAGLVVVSPEESTIALGDTLRLVAEAFDENGHAVGGAAFSWSSSNPGVALVDETGLVKGIAEGTAKITATAGNASGTAEIIVENPDRSALVALYEATNGPSWVDNTNWLTDAPLWEWYGVRIDAFGRVAWLELRGRYHPDALRSIPHGLSGSIPPEIGKLAHLEHLSLDGNDLSGRIPQELGSLANLRRLDLSGNALTGPIPPELGNLTELQQLDLSVNDGIDGEIPPELSKLTELRELHLWRNKLQGRIPPELGNLTKLEVLWLEANDLDGQVPTELGNLTRMRALGLSSNALTGTLPTSLLQLDGLVQIAFDDNDGLCAPGTQAFAEWLEGMEYKERYGAFCNEYDIAALESLYESASGGNWTNSAGWLGGPALDRWYGVVADSLGRVVELDLSRNGLVGRISAALAELDRMTSLRVGGNVLEGPLPLDMANVPLRELHYADTQLCVPADAAFQAWLDAIPSHEGTGAECELTDQDVLEAMYEATDGSNWERNDNWMTDAPLGRWHGVEVDERGRVIAMDLLYNNLTGPIPTEVGNLEELQYLDLSGNYLRGEIPRELGNLTNLRSLSLDWSDLEGEIPPELGDLGKLSDLKLGRNLLAGEIPPELWNLGELRFLELHANSLSGAIPPGIGNLARLERLVLSFNELSGPIPPAVGRLAQLTSLYLGANQLEGQIPPTLGDLKRLERLDVNSNRLSGHLPPELGAMSALRLFLVHNNMLSGSLPAAFGDLARLQVLTLDNNPGLSGPLPTSLIPLRLAEFMAGGTALCAPDEPPFREWLRSIGKRRIRICGARAGAYLTQATQSREYPVPLVAGEDALLRVFVTSLRETAETLPPVRATFFLNGTEAHMVDIPAGSTTIPQDVREGELDRSANAEIPAAVIQPDLEMVVEIDPSGTLDSSLGVSRRIPAEGRTAVEVAAMPTLNLTLVPFVWTGDNDRRTADLVEELSPDHELLWDTNHLLPVDALDISKHDPVLTDSNSGFDLLREVRVIRTMEGGTGHWKGLMYTDEAPAGIAILGGKVSFSKPSPKTIAHELGHNFGLSHAPCGRAGGVDRAFPQHDGRVGVWGYDPRDGGSLVPPSSPDLMGYCGSYWISDYHFSNALAYRLADEGASAATRMAVQSLVVSGQVEADGSLSLDPAFVVDAPPTMPDAPGPYMLTGRRTDGSDLFSIAFDMPEMAHGGGRSGFVFALPVQPEWAGSLASLVLSGPGGRVEMREGSERGQTILRDRQTGRIRAILRELPAAAVEAAMDADVHAAGTGVEVLFSRGIPPTDAWRR